MNNLKPRAMYVGRHSVRTNVVHKIAFEKAVQSKCVLCVVVVFAIVYPQVVVVVMFSGISFLRERHKDVAYILLCQCRYFSIKIKSKSESMLIIMATIR